MQVISFNKYLITDHKDHNSYCEKDKMKNVNIFHVIIVKFIQITCVFFYLFQYAH